MVGATQPIKRTETGVSQVQILPARPYTFNQNMYDLHFFLESGCITVSDDLRNGVRKVEFRLKV
jgi:hypothetical protein